jgi:chromosome segregation ATPase
VVPTLEEEVFKLDDNDQTQYVLIQQTHKDVSTVGHKLAEFRREAMDEFSALRAVTREIKGDTSGLNGDMRRLSFRLDKFNGRIDRIEGKADRHERKLEEHGRKLDEHTRILGEHGRKLDLIIQHFGIAEK